MIITRSLLRITLGGGGAGLEQALWGLLAVAWAVQAWLVGPHRQVSSSSDFAELSRDAFSRRAESERCSRG